MEKAVLVFIGGGGGAVARYLAGQGALRLLGSGWPAGTFAVNVLGGLLMGGLAGWLALRGGGGQTPMGLFLGVGFLGGFTTFSAFSLDAWLMIERRELSGAMIYIAASVLLSIAALWLGLALVKRVLA